MTGIDERRYADPDESIITMAAAAGRDCMARAGVSAQDIGLLIVASGTSPRRFPGPAPSVACLLGLESTPALDVPVASAGSLIALVMADALSANFGLTLVIGAEKLSPILGAAEHPAGTAVLFGDGAGACLVSPDRGFARFLSSAIHTDGSFAEDLRLEFSGPIRMEGRSVIMQAVRKLPAVISEALQKSAKSPDDVEVFLLHQANQNLIARTAKSLDLPLTRFFSNINRYGNTSSASLFIAASEWSQSAILTPGKLACFAVFGAGFHWGALVVEGV